MARMAGGRGARRGLRCQTAGRSDVADRTCSIDGCESPVKSRGWCSKHWQRWYKHGDPEWVPPAPAPPLPCSVDECGDLAHFPEWGMCQKHWTRFKRHGCTDPPHTLRVAERFWSKVNKTGPVPAYRLDLGRCWLWTHYLDVNGYGKFHLSGRSILAHTWSYVSEFGAVPDGLELDHLCRARSCVRPTHLEAVTHAENVRRGAEARRSC